MSVAICSGSQKRHHLIYVLYNGEIKKDADGITHPLSVQNKKAGNWPTLFKNNNYGKYTKLPSMNIISKSHSQQLWKRLFLWKYVETKRVQRKTLTIIIMRSLQTWDMNITVYKLSKTYIQSYLK